LLEQGVEDLGADSQTGGEAQLWLALSYQASTRRQNKQLTVASSSSLSSRTSQYHPQACGREQDAIDACKSVEDNHPMRKLKKQAFDLRYILEAPKLELSDDEILKIPIIQSETWRKE